MAKNRFDRLKHILSGSRGKAKNPTERPSARQQRRVFDTFQRSAQAIFQQSLVGGAERQERFRDYEEMDQVPEISMALNIYADDSSTYSEEGDVIDIISDDDDIVAELEELFYEKLDIEFNLWNWVRNMCKYGDNFLLLDLAEEEGVLGAIQLPALEIDREEGYNGDPNSVRFKWTSQGNTVFESYQVSHQRMLGDDRFLPYGRSILESARKVFKQLSMAEDAMLIYRFTRAPERRVFYIDVGNIPPNDVQTYMLQARDELKRTPQMTDSNGQIDLRYNPPSIDEDFFIPIRGDRGSRVETLPGGSNQGDIEDIQYLQNKLFMSLGVPKSYLTAEDDLGGKGTLAQEDIKFARTIQRVQKIIISELAKIGLVHLHLKGYNEEQIYNFDLELTNPSTVMEMMQLDLIDKRFDIATRMKESGMVDILYVQQNILQIPDSEITKINARLLDDARKQALLDRIVEGEDGEEGDAGGGFGGGDNDLPDREDELSPTDRNPTAVNDPTGTANIPGAKDYTRKEASLDDNDITDRELFIVDPSNFKKKRKRKVKKIDAMDRAISDVFKVDNTLNTISEIIKGGTSLRISDNQKGAVINHMNRRKR